MLDVTWSQGTTVFSTGCVPDYAVPDGLQGESLISLAIADG